MNFRMAVVIAAACSSLSACGASTNGNGQDVDGGLRDVHVTPDVTHDIGATASTCSLVDGGRAGPVALSDGSSDPRRLKALHCRETSSASDLTVELAQTAFESGVFSASLAQTRPTSVQRTFKCLAPSWSGHFFNFNDAAGVFHLRAAGLVPVDAAGNDNVQLYTDPTQQAVIVDSDSILCATDGNP